MAVGDSHSPQAPDEYGTVLAIETSSRRGSVVLRTEAGRRFEITLEREKAHASDLLPAIAELFDRAGAGSEGSIGCDAIVVGTGPGSYTGLRVGIATAFGLVRGTGTKLRGVPSVEALAHAELEQGDEGAIVLNARASEFYFARYRRERDDVRVLHPPCVLRARDLRAHLERETLILGEESVIEAASLSEDVARRVRTNTIPRAAAVLTLGIARLIEHGPQATEEVEPLYLRPFASGSSRSS